MIRQPLTSKLLWADLRMLQNPDASAENRSHPITRPATTERCAAAIKRIFFSAAFEVVYAASWLWYRGLRAALPAMANPYSVGGLFRVRFRMNCSWVPPCEKLQSDHRPAQWVPDVIQWPENHAPQLQHRFRIHQIPGRLLVCFFRLLITQ